MRRPPAWEVGGASVMRSHATSGLSWFRDFSLPGIFAPWNESSRELSSQGANVPGNIRPAERRGANCTSNYKLHITHKLLLKPIYWRRCLQLRVRVNWEHSLPGTKVPGNIRSQERKFPGTFVHGSEGSHWELSLRGAKIPGSEKSRYPTSVQLYIRFINHNQDS